MAKKIIKNTKIKRPKHMSLETENDGAFKNSFSDIIGFPQNQGVRGTEQLSNSNTLFKNLRYYLISNFRQLLSQMYAELGLIQTIVDVPVDDAFRGGVEIKSKQLDEDQIVELQTALERDDIYTAVAEAMKWNRLYGGAAILVMTDQPSDTPLNANEIKEDSPLEFKAVDMWELFFDRQNIDMDDASMAALNTEGRAVKVDNYSEEEEFFNYYGSKVHRSRVFLIKGIKPPSFIRPRLRGWGLSVCEKIVRPLNQYLKTADLTFEVLDEFKLDVYKLKNLASSFFSADGEEKVRRRMEMVNFQKNYQNAVVLDSEDDFDHKQLTFAGLAEVMKGNQMLIASDMRMPLTKIFGISAAGFNSGEDDIEVYNAMVESEVRSKIKFPFLKVIEIKCQQMFGFIPDDLKISFKPLRILSSEQEEIVKTQKFTRALQAKQAGEITRFEFRELCNKDETFSITLDNADSSLNPDDSDVNDLVSGQVEEDQAEETGKEDLKDQFKNKLKNVFKNKES